MRTFAREGQPIQQDKPAGSTSGSRSFSGGDREVDTSLDLYGRSKNPLDQREQANPGKPETQFSTTTSTGFRLDFSQIPLHAKTGTAIQPKLTVSAPGDIFEREAEHVADQVMRMPEPNAESVLHSCDDFSRCKTESERPEKLLRTKHAGESNFATTTIPNVARGVLSPSGQMLDAGTRAFMEPRFGYDFSKVQIHTDAKAVAAAKRISARAFTVGEHIAFAQGEFSPQTQSGKRLLAHELSHAIQYRQRPSGTANSAVVYRYPADHPYNDTVTFDRIDRRAGIHQGITVHIPRELNGATVGLQTAIACVQAALRMDVQRRRVSQLVAESESLRSAIEESLERQGDQQTIDIVVRYSRQPERDNRVSTLQIEPSGPVEVEETETEDAEEDPRRVGFCFRWTPVDDQYVFRRILELITQHGGDTGLAFSQIREERNQPENCCNLNHTAIEHYLMFRSDVGDGSTSAAQARAEVLAGAVVRPATRMFRTGNCPVSPLSWDVIRWEDRGINDGERDLETTPQVRGVGGLSNSEFLARRLRNTTRLAR